MRTVGWEQFLFVNRLPKEAVDDPHSWKCSEIKMNGALSNVV